MLTPAARPAILVLDLLMALYFVAWSVSQIAMGLFAVAHVRFHLLRNTRRARALVVKAASPPLVSVVAPAFNEQLTIEESVRAMLALDYDSSEIVIVNDGSTDETLSVLTAAFNLVAAPVAFAQPLATAPLRGVYRSISEPALVVIDKENGRSKADAVNAGINAASGALVLVIDADTILERDALSRAVLPFLEDSTTVGVGGTIGIANGCRIQGGRVVDVSLPRSWLARFQIVEYMRGFLLFRMACASRNAIVLISGAFGLFRRDVMIAVGGYDPTAIGEDMDVTVRIQRYCRELPTVSNHIRSKSAGVDAGAGRLDILERPALPVASWSAAGPLAPSPHDREPAVRPRRPRRAAPRSVDRRDGSAVRDNRLCGRHRGRRVWPG